MAQQIPEPKIQTLEITNFKGALAPQAHGQIDKGFSPWGGGGVGYNSLWNNYKGQVLDFMEAVADISTGLTGTNPTIVHFALAQNSSSQSGNQSFIYALDEYGNVYEIETINNSSGWKPDNDAITAFTNITGTIPTCLYGGGFLASAIKTGDGNPTLFVAYDTGISRASLTVGNQISPSAATWAQLSWLSGSYVNNIPHPMAEFVGTLILGNGKNLAQSTDGASVSDAILNPGFPSNYLIKDLAVSPDGTYLAILMTDTQGAPSTLAVDPTSTTNISWPPDSAIALWNGASPASYSSIQFFKGVNLSCLAVSNTKMIVIGTDDEGLGIWDLAGNKLAGLPNNSSTSAFRPPISQSAWAVGDKFFFQVDDGTGIIWVFCFDSLDNSLYPLAQKTYTTSPVTGAVAVPTLRVNTESASTFSDIARTKIFFSNNKKLYRLHLQNIYGGSTSTTANWQSMYQKLPRKADIKEVRVYLANTHSNVSFTISIDTVFNTPANAANSYTYSSSDGVKDCVKFTPEMKGVKEIGVQISNAGTSNPLIQKVEIDYELIDDVPVL